MCGITGFFTPEGLDNEASHRLRRMADAIRHRGPDDHGEWIDAPAGIALGHRRLSIIDLSCEGHQPMASHSGRYEIVFNGEIYNYLEIAEELRARGLRFRGHADTEVILSGFDTWGVRATIERMAGMFAFALWDREERVLHLVRDRMGEKPLYYGWMGGTLLFGSELKALRAHPAWKAGIDRGALMLLMRYNYIPAPYSIYEGVRKVVPGTMLAFRIPGEEPVPEVYWDARTVAEHGVANPLVGSAAEIGDEVEASLRRTIRQEMISDVPIGAFLSGGIDSSAVVALMQAESGQPVRTFTIGFEEKEYNEAIHARAVATHLGTEHTELYVTPEEAMAVIPRLPALYDEPFGDSSQVPTFLVSQLARTRVTVSLSGDGGDEMMGGYNRYFLGTRLWNAVRPIPRVARQLAVRGMTAVPARRWDSLYRSASVAIPRRYRLSVPGDKIHKLAGILGVDSMESMYRELVSHWRQPEHVVLGAREPMTILSDRSRWPALPTFTQRMMYLDTVTYLADDIMVKVDRASMGVSLESRAPFLDHRFAELAWRVPLDLKVRGGQGKWLLRQILYKYVPKALVERPKMGFGIPIDRWLRGPLKAWANDLLAPERLAREGYLNAGAVREKWNEHQSGQRNWQYLLWGVTMFQSWLEHNS